jgi:PhzF family phenazine biosynthesis protein
MGLQIFQVDAFTDAPFKGNPAAVCILPEERDNSWMQNVAKEMNLSETAFLRKQSDGYRLRWFTPAVEVKLCGHATLASAHILWTEGFLNPNERARFQTLSGGLTAERTGEWIELDFPALPPKQISAPRALMKALGTKAKYVGKSREDYLVELESEREVRKLKPDFQLLSSLPVRGVAVTAAAKTEPYDFISRFFAPQVGINEDPVTGSAHCSLGPYWRRRLNKDQFLAYQASSRGGEVRVRVGDERVYIGGKAITVLRADLID